MKYETNSIIIALEQAIIYSFANLAFIDVENYRQISSIHEFDDCDYVTTIELQKPFPGSMGLVIEKKFSEEIVATILGDDYKDESISNRMMEMEPLGIDAVFDAIGGESFKTSFKLLKKQGILVPYGFYKNSTGQGGNVALEFMQLKLWNLLPNGKKVDFYSIGEMRNKHPEWFIEDLRELFKMLKEGKLAPVIARHLPLKEAEKAHKLIDEALVKGRLVLQIGE